MVPVVSEAGTNCLDRYEVSVGDGCPVSDPATVTDTSTNLATPGCIPQSQAAAVPWRNVTYVQAVALCARAGKFLPSAGLWYHGAVGTPDSLATCTLWGQLAKTGAAADCRSGVGAFDMIGNVWEIVDSRAATDQIFPAPGYVTAIDPFGLPAKTASSSEVAYGDDYFWYPRNEAVAAVSLLVLRGGFYNSGRDGGVYSTHAGNGQNFSSAAIGFRCAKSL